MTTKVAHACQLAGVLFLLIATTRGIKAITPERVYVLTFQSPTIRDQGLLKSFADQFETALINTHHYVVLNRQNIASLLREAQGESQLASLQGVANRTRSQLQALEKADGVIFGNVVDDIGSGEFVITVAMETFDSVKQWQYSTRMKHGVVQDYDQRDQAVEAIVKKLGGPSKGDTSLISQEPSSVDVTGKLTSPPNGGQTIGAIPAAGNGAGVQRSIDTRGLFGPLQMSPQNERLIGRMQYYDEILSGYHCENQSAAIVCVFGITRNGSGSMVYNDTSWASNKLVDDAGDDHAREKTYYLTKRGEERNTLSVSKEDIGYMVQEFAGPRSDIKTVKLVSPQTGGQMIGPIPVEGNGPGVQHTIDPRAPFGSFRMSPQNERLIGKMQYYDEILSGYHCENQSAAIVCVFGITRNGSGSMVYNDTSWASNKLVDDAGDDHAREKTYYLTKRGEERNTLSVSKEDISYMVQEFAGPRSDIKTVKLVSPQTGGQMIGPIPIEGNGPGVQHTIDRHAPFGSFRMSPQNERLIGKVQYYDEILSGYHCENQSAAIVCVFGITRNGSGSMVYNDTSWASNKLVDDAGDDHAREKTYYLTKRGEERNALSVSKEDISYMVQEFAGPRSDIKTVKLVSPQTGGQIIGPIPVK